MIQGWLHAPLETAQPCGRGLVMAHGAGSNCESPLLTAVAEEFAQAGFYALRVDLAYRQQRPQGPPRKGDPERDREVLRAAVTYLRDITAFVMLGGHSYGGRQSTMLAAEDPSAADALLLLSYPLHPPRKPDELRAGHLPELRTPSLFIHGSRDPFGTIAEMEDALRLIPARHELVKLEKTGHELKPELAPAILREALNFLR
jgi:uncharacterized protein